MDDHGGYPQPTERGRPVRRGDGGCLLAEPAGRVVRAVVGRDRAGPRGLLVEGEATPGERAGPRDGGLDSGLAAGRRGRAHDRDGVGVRPADRRVPGAGHDRAERQHPLRPPDRHQLRDHAAHRRAEEVGAVQPEGVEEPDGVGGHLVEGVRERAQVAPADRLVVGGPFHPLRQPDVTVVEADDEEPRGDEIIDVAPVPPVQLRALTHDHQQRRVGRIAVGRAVQVDAVRRDRPGHLDSRPGGSRSHPDLLVLGLDRTVRRSC